MKPHKALRNDMSILEHIQELRAYLLRALCYLILCSLIALFFMEEIISFLQRPYTQVIQKVTEQLGTQKLTAINVFEVMTVNFKVCFLAGFLIGLPLMLRELWKFIAPALYPVEKKLALIFLCASFLLFYFGIFCGYTYIIPLFLENALLWASKYALVSITFENYFSALITMILIFGIIFEMPVILSLLGLLGILPAKALRKYRRFIFLACFILGAILAPPDVLSMCLIALPMYAMVELSILIIDKISLR